MQSDLWVQPTKTINGGWTWGHDAPRCHRAPRTPNASRPVVLLLILAFTTPFLINAVMPDNHAPETTLSAPLTPVPTEPTLPVLEPLNEPSAAYVAPPYVRASAVAPEQTKPSKVEIVISFALAQQGKRYVFGSAGPNTYDCSGLVKRAFAQIGMDLYHYTGRMMTYGQRVDRANLQRGDIVFPLASHVGIYLGGNKMVQASSGSGKVIVSNVYAFYTARRLL